MKTWIFILGIAGSLFFTVPSARADTLNQHERFFISSQYEQSSRTHVNATLRLVSDRAYWYISDEITTIPYLADLAREFDTRIYPTETAQFGAEPNPGIDGDPRITIVIAPLKENIGGYFDTSHQYSVNRVPDSNEREMIYLNALVDDRNLFSQFLAHEFQHLITFQQKDALRQSDDVWLNELRSEYAISLLGYNDTFDGSSSQRRVTAFLQSPSDSLTEWKNLGPDYGAIAVFAEYIAEQTSPAILTATARTQNPGMAGLAEALTQNGFSLLPVELFSNWLSASFLNDAAIGAAYRYTRSGFSSMRVTPTFALASPRDDTVYTVPLNAKDWQGHWIDVSSLSAGQNNVLRFSFDSPSLGSFHIPYAVLHRDGRWSVSAFDPNFKQSTLDIPDIGSDIVRAVLMPFKHDKLFGFGSDEPSILLNITITRIAAAAPIPNDLREGDFIRAEGDNDVYIINAYGYKRLVINPQICLMYGHLGARGCFGAVKIVTPAMRDRYRTSWYVTNGETLNGVIYQITQTGDDSARLTRAAAPDPHSVFLINSREQNAYQR